MGDRCGVVGHSFSERSGKRKDRRFGLEIGCMEICSKNKQRFVEQASIILQTDPNMLQECFNLSQLPSPNEGLVLCGLYIISE